MSQSHNVTNPHFPVFLTRFVIRDSRGSRRPHPHCFILFTNFNELRTADFWWFHKLFVPLHVFKNKYRKIYKTER